MHRECGAAIPAALAAALLLFLPSRAQAQCTADADCGPELVCESKTCVQRMSAAPASGAQSASPAASVITEAPGVPVKAASPTAPVLARSDTEPTPRHLSAAGSPQQQPTKMRSPVVFWIGIAAMGGGVGLMTVGVRTRIDEKLCRGILGGWNNDPACDKGASTQLIAGLLLTLGGVPLVVIGAKRVPTPVRVTLLPSAGSRGGGLRLRVDF